MVPEATCGNCCLKLANNSSPGFRELVLGKGKGSAKFSNNVGHARVGMAATGRMRMTRRAYNWPPKQRALEPARPSGHLRLSNAYRWLNMGKRAGLPIPDTEFPLRSTVALPEPFFGSRQGGKPFVPGLSKLDWVIAFNSQCIGRARFYTVGKRRSAGDSSQYTASYRVFDPEQGNVVIRLG